MGGRIVDLLSGPHHTTEALLPWLINGTLSDIERDQLEQHLQSCAQCRAELAREREVTNFYVAARGSDASLDVEAALARMRARIAEPPPKQPAPLTPLGWWRLGFGVQTAVVLLLGATLLLQTMPGWFSDEGAPYRGLGSAQRAAGDALVVFDPAASEALVQRALRQAGARIVDGPTAAGAYIVRFDGEAAAALGALRGNAVVIRAELLTAAR